MYVLLCYDICANRRRTKLHKVLKGFMKPVQKSVFEGEIPESRMGDLRQVIGKTIDRERDTVRLYQLSRKSRAATELIGASVTVENDGDVIV